MGLKTTIKAAIEYKLTGSPDLGSAIAKFDGWPETVLEGGTTAQKADVVFSDTITLSASGSQNLDLAGSLENALGGAAVFAKVKAIAVKASPANTNDVVVGGAGSNTFDGPFADSSDKINVAPGGVLLVTAPAAGWDVTADTGDILTVANGAGGTSVTFDIIIIGTSA